MNAFGFDYASLYDLFYREKDYSKEVDYVEQLINKFACHPKDILELGCGTGRHAEILCKKGYSVHGVDISREMLTIAEKRCAERDLEISFSNSDIANLNVSREFDVAVSLFHVISYITSKAELAKVFDNVKNHLRPDGLFIFDFWYGPAVLTDQPENRIKRYESNDLQITRIAEPTILLDQNLVEIAYTLFIQNKNSNEIQKFEEKHRLRYFFDQELEEIIINEGLKLVGKFEWMKMQRPDGNNWYALWILKK